MRKALYQTDVADWWRTNLPNEMVRWYLTLTELKSSLVIELVHLFSRETPQNGDWREFRRPCETSCLSPFCPAATARLRCRQRCLPDPPPVLLTLSFHFIAGVAVTLTCDPIRVNSSTSAGAAIAPVNASTNETCFFFPVDVP